MMTINEKGEPVINELPKCCIEGCNEPARFMIKVDFYCGKHFGEYYTIMEKMQSLQTEKIKRLIKK